MSLFITDRKIFNFFKRDIEKCFDVERQLPDQVFKAGFSGYRFEEFDWAMSADSWVAIRAIAAMCGDDSVRVAVLDPDPEAYYKKEFGCYNWAELSVSSSSEAYWDLLNSHPIESPADSILANSEKVVWSGSSLEWAVWGERSLGLCILGSRVVRFNDRWNDVQWALGITKPVSLRGDPVVGEFAARLRRNYES